MRIYRTILSSLSPWLVILMVLSHSGCSIQEHAPPDVESAHEREIPEDIEKRSNDPQVDDEQIIIDDLLTALIQLFPPEDSTIQISAVDNNELTLLVANAMALAGFGIQKVTSDQGASLLTTDIRTEEQAGSNLARKHVRIDIGQVSIGRSYRSTNDRTILPSSPFKLYGTRATIDVNKTLFGTGSTLAGTEYLAPIKLDGRLPLLSLVTPDIVQSAANEKSNLPDLTSINSAKVEVNNLHFGESTFQSVLYNHQLLDDLTVIFPNDSLTLGGENKLLIRQFMREFVERLDLVSVVGCSNGPTTAAIGNAGLALGRGERVTNELLSIGVPREKILDQGCWAPSAVGKYPGRGVVLELWREKG